MSLTPYLQQLCQDLKACQGQFPDPPNMRALAPDPAYPDFMAGSMQYLYGPSYRMSELFEIEAERFPPAAQLSEQEKLQVVEAILVVWRSLNVEADLPKRMPLHLAYEALTRYWADEKISIVTDGMIHLEFCSYEPNDCPWNRKYCNCSDS